MLAGMVIYPLAQAKAFLRLYREVSSPAPDALDSLVRLDREATAYTSREAPYNFLMVGMWGDPVQDTTAIPWVRGLWQALQPFASGNIYVNYASDVGVDRVQAAYGAATYARLVALKNTYDPTHVFRLNANIKPTV